MFVSVREAARQLGCSEQTVRNRVNDRELRAIQSAPGGAYRIPTLEIEAFKRRHGLAPRIETAVPSGVVYSTPEELLKDQVLPALAAHGLSSPEEALRAVQEDPGLLVRYSDVFTAYAAYVGAISQRAMAAAG
jgi:excisionase family DNA binding protein